LERISPFSFVFRPEADVQIINSEGKIVIGKIGDAINEKAVEDPVVEVENPEIPIFRVNASAPKKVRLAVPESVPVNEIELKPNDRWTIRLEQLDTQLELERLNAYL